MVEALPRRTAIATAGCKQYQKKKKKKEARGQRASDTSTSVRPRNKISNHTPSVGKEQ
jgi:hypothetical protein